MEVMNSLNGVLGIVSYIKYKYYIKIKDTTFSSLDSTMTLLFSSKICIFRYFIRTLSLKARILEETEQCAFESFTVTPNCVKHNNYMYN